MSVVIAVQARMGSKRLPGKTLQSIAGRPLLEHLVQALRKNRSDCQVYVLTSKNKDDQAIVAFCQDNEILVRTGAEEDVASRFLELVREVRPRYVVRVSADSPLLAPEVVNDVLSICFEQDFDLVTTVSKRPYPSGMHVEAIRSDVFEESYRSFSQPEHFEHVTSFFYEHSGLFSMCRLECPIAHAERYKFSCDTPEDLVRIERFFAKLDRPHYCYSLRDKCSFYGELLARE